MPNTPTPYQYLTFAQAKAALALRLTDPNKVFWTDAELGLYIIEALRTWNAITRSWVQEYTFNRNSADSRWIDLTTLPSSPRTRTVTDTDIFTLGQYHLLEVPSGSGAWGGTSQFTLADMQQALQRRHDEMLQVTGCATKAFAAVTVSPGIRHIPLTDRQLDVYRVRFVPTPSSGLSPCVLWREDIQAFQYFSPQYNQIGNRLPTSFSMVPTPPVSLEINYAPPCAGTYFLIGVEANATFTPPASTVLQIPDDWAWVAKWGMLADLLSKQSESRDDPRAQYCWMRYTSGMALMQKLPWINNAFLNSTSAGIVSAIEMDRFSSNWMDNSSARPGVVVAGVDLITVCPLPPAAPAETTVMLYLVQSAPVPSLDGDLVQINRDSLDALYDYCEHLAAFKMGGAEFLSTMPQLKSFFLATQISDALTAEAGIFVSTMDQQGQRQEDNLTRVRKSVLSGTGPIKKLGER